MTGKAPPAPKAPGVVVSMMGDWLGRLRSALREERPPSPPPPPSADGGRAATLIFTAVALAACLAVLLAERYAGIFHRHSIGWALLFAMAALGRFASFQAPPGRLLVILLGALISIRYMAWRTSTTLVYTTPLDAVGMVLLYVAECYAFAVHFLGMFGSLWPLDRPPMPLKGASDAYPSVDVFIPTYSEPVELVYRTVVAASQIRYPKDKLRVYVLDDGATAEKTASTGPGDPAWERRRALSGLTARLGAGYIARERNEHAKAGNINYALGRTSGDLILILDCDHVPTEDILENTVGYFQRDPKLGFVQSPHFLGNPSVIEKNLSHFSNSPRENDMFYNLIHRGLDSWNSSYFCGSAAVLNRKALTAIGGLSVDTVTEDVETSMRIHAHGYNSVYVRRPMICGLEPETWASFVVQKVRWAQGMAQIFVLKNPLFQKGVGLAQKLNYFNACFYWFFSFSRLFFFLAPILFLAFGMRIYHASSSQIVSYTLPHVLSVYVLMAFLYGRSRRLFLSEIYETTQMMVLAPALIAVLLRPRSPVFKITPKDQKVEKEALNTHGALPVFFILLVNLVALPLSLGKWFSHPLYRDVILIGSLWCAYNSFIAIMALGAFFERKEHRWGFRIRVREDVRLHVPALGREVYARMRDLSLNGATVQLKLPPDAAAAWAAAPGDAVELRSEQYGPRFSLHAAVKDRRARGAVLELGLQYMADRNSYKDVVRFTYGASRRWADVLRRRASGRLRTLFVDYLYFLYRGMKGVGVVLTHAARRLVSPPSRPPAPSREQTTTGAFVQ
jgi:cellulose synthase (UDP-forming)